MSTSALELQKPALPEYQEQNVSMVQQLAQAQIQSAYIMAERHPRDWDVVEEKILKECRRPQFVAIDPDPKKYGSSIAMYGVPRGGEYQYRNGEKVWVPNIIRDFTIRFAEMALPYIKNASVDLWPMGEDDSQRIFRAVRVDFESNVAEGEIMIVPKTVERSKTKDGDFIVSQRTNSKGYQVFIIRATNEEMDTTKAALYSKRKRNLILSMMPGWLKEKAKQTILATQRNADAQDPDSARKAIYAAFAQVGVTVEDIKSFMGHGNDLNPAELEDLRALYAGIAGGHTTWKEIVAAKEEAAGGDESVTSQIDALFKELELPVAQIRKKKGQYAGQPAENLLKWLTEEVAKKKNDGGKKEAPANPTGQVGEQQQNGPAATSSSATPSSTPTATIQNHAETEENLDAEPPEPQQDTKKAGPVATPKPKATPPPAPTGREGW